MKKIEGPITDENFSSVWKYTDKKIIELKKKNMVANILKLTSNIAFLFSMLMIIYVVLRYVEVQINLTCLSSVPIFHDAWDFINSNFINLNTDLAVSLPQLIILAILFPFCVNILTFFIIWIVYHPKHKEITGDKQLDSKTLFDMSRELKLRKEQERGIFSLLYGLLYMIGIVAFIFFMLIKFLATNNLMILIPLLRIVSPAPIIDEITQMTGTDVIAGYMNYVIYILIFIYVVYTILNVISNLFVRFLYKTKVKTFYIEEAGEFCYMYNPLLKEEREKESEILSEASKIRLKETNRIALTEEETEILKKSSEIIEKRTAENKKILNISPVSKFIKIGKYAIILVLVLVSANKIKNMDFQGIYNMLEVPSVVESIPVEEVAPIIESITEEDLLAVISNIPEKEYNNVVKGLSKVSALNISKDISKEELAKKIGNMTNEEVSDILNNLTDKDLFNILDGLPKEQINDYLENNMFKEL